MTSVSMVIISFNEGESLRQTIDNLLATLTSTAEIIVVDDQSTDGSAAFIAELKDAYGRVQLLRPDSRLGVAGARNFGAAHATGDVLVFSDAHVITPPGWLDPLLDVLARPEVGAVAPAISDGRSAGYGQKWSDASLAVEWLSRQGTEPYPVPLLCGCFLAMRREVFEQTRQFDSGMVMWGAEDSELSMRLWMCAYQCWIVPGVEVQHAFRAKFPYEVKWEPVLHNRLRLATLHFGPRRLLRVINRLKHYDEFAAASVRLLASDLAVRSAQLRTLQRHDDDWVFNRFQMELRSELSFATAHKPCVTACLISWKRPQNLPQIVNVLRQLEFINEILIWNNNPAIPLEFADPKVRLIQSAENQSCYGRFLCAAEARNAVVYVQDDDALNADIVGLYEQYLLDSQRITYALAPTHWPRRHRRTYGESQAALVGWGAFFRKEWLSVLNDLPAELRCDPLFQREADAFFTILLERHHNPVAGQIMHLEDHSTPGIALWRDDCHQRSTAMAIGQALGLLRRKHDYVLPWNVVIPCRNYARYLRDAVESVLTNDADYQITIVDDASDDLTHEIASALVEQFANIRYLRNYEKRGPGYSRNRGIEAVQSTFVVLLDADDRLGPNYLHEAGKLLLNGYDVVNPDANLFGAKESLWIVPESTSLRMLLDRNSVHYCSAFRRQLWSQAGGIDESMPCWMDYEFWIRLAAAGARIQGLHGDHFFYRQHGANLTETANGMKDELREYVRKKHAALYESFGMEL
jgi:glycosyltransferase involved in cell wall biosynthesis